MNHYSFNNSTIFIHKTIVFHLSLRGKEIAARRVGKSATAMKSPPFFSVLFLAATVLLLVSETLAEIRFTEIRNDDRSIIPLDDFGFTHTGHLNLILSGITYSNSTTDLSLLGFFLSTRDAWFHVMEQLLQREIGCAIQSEFVKKVLTLDGNQQYNANLSVSDANQFTLVFANCIPNLKVSMNIHSSMYNLDNKSNLRDYLSAGKTNLPSIYSIFFLAYVFVTGIWIYTIYSKIVSVYQIHFFMLAVVILKALNLLCEAEDKSHIKKTGTSHGWDVIFYIFSFLKGISLFTLIVLIGTGWSFLKPYLQDKEKKVLMIVIPLQVMANVAQVVIGESGPYDQDAYTWKQVFLLVDIICCCAVLFPIVWSIKNLREAARIDGKAAVNLMKLTLFRQYYIVVICYVYFTRVVIYGLETITSYRYQWMSVVAAELATLAFYVFTGYNFRPKSHNPYFALDDDEEETAAADALKLEDEFEL